MEYVIYCDTDSVMNIQKVDEAPKVKKGDYLSDLTDTLEEFSYWSFIEDVVWVTLKQCIFGLFPPTGKRTSECKMKGITPNYNNSEDVKLTFSRNIILEEITP